MADPQNPEGISISIDDALLEAALAAVDRSSRKAAPGSEGVELEISLEPPTRSSLPPVESGPNIDHLLEDRRRLSSKNRELQFRIHKLEAELVQAREARELLERQIPDLRQAATARQAEIDSIRVRYRKERDDAEQQVENRMVKPLLDIVDNLERAWSHASSDPSRIQSGLQMIVEQFRNHLKRVGAERIVAGRGTPFDPTLHEAILHLPVSDLEPGSIVEEVSSGFKLHGRLLRAARVVVAAAQKG